MYISLKDGPWIEIEKSSTPIVSDMPDEHLHDHYELYFLLSGERRYFIGNEIYNVAPGNLVVVPKNVIHRTQAFNQKGYDRYVINFSERSVEELRRELGDALFSSFLSLGCIQLPHDEVRVMRERFEKMFAEQAKNDALSYSMRKSLLTEIVVCALRYGKKKSCSAGEGADKIQLVAHYINENFFEPLSLETAARMACMEKTYFSKRFKALTGLNFSNYLIRVRLGAAERLLLTTTMNISEISSACGFSGSNYFGDAFARLHGMSPSEYRRRAGE